MATMTDELATSVLWIFRLKDRKGEALPWSPDQELLEALAILRRGGLSVRESTFPEVSALGPLPAAYIEGRPVRFDLLSCLARTGAASDAPAEAKENLQAIEATLGRLVDATLWLHRPCYRKYTKPAFVRSTSALLRPLLEVFLWRRSRALPREGGSNPEERVKSACSSFQAWLEREAPGLEDAALRLKAGAEPSAADVLIYSFAKVLQAIPTKHVPWDFEVPGFRALLKFYEAFEDLLKLRKSETGSSPAGACANLFPPEVVAQLDAAAEEEENDTGDAIPLGAADRNQRLIERWRRHGALAGRPEDQQQQSQQQQQQQEQQEEDASHPASSSSSGGTSKVLPKSLDQAIAHVQASFGQIAARFPGWSGEAGGPAASRLWRHNALFASWCTLSGFSYFLWRYHQQHQRGVEAGASAK